MKPAKIDHDRGRRGLIAGGVGNHDVDPVENTYSRAVDAQLESKLRHR
jgi:hypothetical protein